MGPEPPADPLGAGASPERPDPPPAEAPTPAAAEAPPLRDAARALAQALGRETATAGRRAGTILAGGLGQAGRGGARAARAASERLRAGAGGLRARLDRARAARAEARAATGAPPRRLRLPSLAPLARAVRRTWALSLGLLLAVVLGGALALTLAWGAMRDLPLADVLPPLEAASLSVRTSDGEVLTRRGAFRAPYVALEEMPPHLLEAVIAVEDRRFREHGGVDLRGVTRALWRNVAAGRVVEGGSTITQQLVKILYLEPDRTLRRKLQEAVLATMLERQLGKDRILELYLNSVYLGTGAYGMPAAAQSYFGKEVGELTLAEAAMLAGTIQLPSQVNPVADLAAAQDRAALVVTLMAEQGRLPAEGRDPALAAIARLSPDPPPSRAGSYFADWVVGELAALEGAAGESLVATATLDPALQAEAERIVREVMEEQGAAVGATQAALVAMTPDGRVRAMVGGLDYAASEFNRATEARRQPGSTFKLFVYLAALAMGAEPDMVIEDAPIEIDGWEPQNFDGQSHGRVTLREAFARSHNLATVRLAQEVGIDTVAGVARQFGIEADLAATPSLALGTSEVTLLDLTEAYAAVAFGRAPIAATGIETLRIGEDGTPMAFRRANEAVEEVALNRTRAPIIEMLRAVVEEGTGRNAATGGFAAGKTGTSQDSRDAWFVGFDSTLVVGVWVGNDDNSPMADVTGGALPAEIWRRVILAAGGADDAAPPAEGGTQQVAAAGPQCDIRACAAAYRSFRASDCTFQPYDGPRRLCTR